MIETQQSADLKLIHRGMNKERGTKTNSASTLLNDNDHFAIVKSMVDLVIGMFVVHTAVAVPLEENMVAAVSFEDD